MSRAFVAIVVFAGVLVSTVASAQSLGTFRWQLEPNCNIVTVTVTQSGNVFRLEGTDDQCGAGDLASAIGTAFLNPDGTVGIGLNVISTPGGAPVHVDASIDVSSLGGTWRDSAGNSGNFVHRTGGGSGGSPRKLTETIGAVAVNPAQVQLRIGGTCSSGSFMTSIGQNGAVTCGSNGTPVTAVNAGAGMAVTGTGSAVTVALQTTPSGGFRFTSNSGFFSNGTYGNGFIPVQGPGTRAMWYPGKAAFRAGIVVGTEWDDANIGSESVAFNKNTRAAGTFSAAFGDSTLASGVASTAMGAFTVASGPTSVAMGAHTAATGPDSFAMGEEARTEGGQSVAMGWKVTAGANGSIVLGSYAGSINAATGSIILSDRSSTALFTGFTSNEFLVRAAGGTSIYSNALLTAGVALAPGASAWSVISDVNMKENFRDLDADDVLSKIARMPIREWNYKTQDAAIRHIGPTAQDFRAAFGLGEDPLRISTIDADGIALRAIQALEARVRAYEARIQTLEQEIVTMRTNSGAMR